MTVLDRLSIDPNSLLASLQSGVVVHAADTTIRYANPKALELLRLSEDQALGKSAMDPHWRFLDEIGNDLLPSQYPVNEVIRTNSSLSNKVIGIVDSSSENVTWVLLSAYPEFNAANTIEQVIVSFADYTNHKATIPFDEIVDKANDVVLVTKSSPVDGNGPEIVYANRAFSDLTGYSCDEVLGLTPRLLQGENTSPETREAIKSALQEHQSIRVDILNYTKQGDEYWLDMNIFPLTSEKGDVQFFAAIERDVTDQKYLQKKLEKLAIMDPLTDLLNRRGIEEHAKALISEAKRHNTNLFLALIDLDYFKNINDTYGHSTGDEVLRHFAAIAKDEFRQEDSIGRFGGEEFLVFIKGVDKEEGMNILSRFRERISKTSIASEKNESVQFTCSIGATSLSEHDKELDDLVRRADKALYMIKENGRNQLLFLR